MPNYVRNIVTFKGTKEKLEELISYLKKSGHNELKFTYILRVPEELYAVESCENEVEVAIGEYLMDGTLNCMNLPSLIYGTVKAEMEAMLHFTCHTDIELMKMYMAHKLMNGYMEANYWSKCIKWYANYKKYGVADWYGWCVDKWGTKWNPCDADTFDVLLPMKETADVYSMRYCFSTAWDIPKGIYEALSKHFPEISMEVEYADEDYGYNCGHICYKNGEVSTIHAYEDDEMESFAFSMRIWDHEELLAYVKKAEDGHLVFDVDAYDDYLTSKAF